MAEAVEVNVPSAIKGEVPSLEAFKAWVTKASPASPRPDPVGIVDYGER
jgi:hypothetical protein